MSIQAEMRVDSKPKKGWVLRAGVGALLLAILAIVAGVVWYQRINARPSAERQAEEVAALETHVLPLVKDLRATWYLNERFGGGHIHWQRGHFTNDPERAREQGDTLFDKETEKAFAQLSQAIGASEVPIQRLREATFADDGTLRAAAFQRRGGGIELVFTYIYSPGAQPEEWTSPLGPVVLTRIGGSDWWFEQSPDD